MPLVARAYVLAFLTADRDSKVLVDSFQHRLRFFGFFVAQSYAVLSCFPACSCLMLMAHVVLCAV